MSMMFVDLLRRILIHDPAQRARVIDIQSHKWMSKVYPQGTLVARSNPYANVSLQTAVNRIINY